MAKNIIADLVQKLVADFAQKLVADSAQKLTGSIKSQDATDNLRCHCKINIFVKVFCKH